MRKKLLAVITATMIIGGMGYNSFAQMNLELASDGCYYKSKKCWFNSGSKCAGSGLDCGLATKC